MDLLTYSELKYFSTWKECSKDSANNVSMIDSDKRVINFDTVKTKYLNNLKKSEESAASVDAMGQDKDGHAYMVEFKNGKIDADNIRNKVAESLLLFLDITHSSLRDTRQQVDFLLVYNPSQLHLRPEQKKALHLARLGKGPCPLYGLDKYQGTFFSRAYMVTDKWFSDNMAEVISI